MLFLARKTHPQLVLVVLDYCSNHLDIPNYPCRHRCFFHYILLYNNVGRTDWRSIIYIFWIWYIIRQQINFPNEKGVFSPCILTFANVCQPKKKTTRNRIFGHCRIDPGTGFRGGMMRWVENFYWWLFCPPFQGFFFEGVNPALFLATQGSLIFFKAPFWHLICFEPPPVFPWSFMCVGGPPSTRKAMYTVLEFHSDA